jgi:RNA polymerase sigma factor (sigma-70 family)
MTFPSYAYGRIVGSMIDHVRCITRSRNRWSCAPVLAADEDIQAVPDHTPDPERATLYSELRRIVHSLPARQKHLLIRHYFDGEHLDDAGQEIGISKTTASKTLASAIATLRLKLEAPATLPTGGRHTLSN